jgi:hypothetical protein
VVGVRILVRFPLKTHEWNSTCRTARPRQIARYSQHVSEEFGLPLSLLRVALDFYATPPDEVDARITVNERAVERIRKLIERRERLLSR